MKRFLVIGLGSIGRRHARNLADLYPDAAFTFLRHRNTRDAFCDALNAEVTADLDAILDHDFDLVVLASPSANHIDTLPKLIKRGWPLLVEKPIVTSLEDCDAITALLNDAPKAVRASGFNFRHIPSLRHIRDRIADGALGTITRASLVAGQWLPDWRPDQDYRTGYSADASRGGGVEMDLVHEIDLVRWFFGEVDLRFAVSGQLSALDLKSNDTSVMVMQGQGGGPLVHVALDYVSRQRVRQYEIVGDKGSLFWNIAGTLELVESGKRTLIENVDGGFDVGQSYVDMLQRSFEAQSGAWPDPLQSLEDGIMSTRLAISARDFEERK